MTRGQSESVWSIRGVPFELREIAKTESIDKGVTLGVLLTDILAAHFEGRSADEDDIMSGNAGCALERRPKQEDEHEGEPGALMALGTAPAARGQEGFHDDMLLSESELQRLVQTHEQTKRPILTLPRQVDDQYAARPGSLRQAFDDMLDDEDDGFAAGFPDRKQKDKDAVSATHRFHWSKIVGLLLLAGGVYFGGQFALKGMWSKEAPTVAAAVDGHESAATSGTGESPAGMIAATAPQPGLRSDLSAGSGEAPRAKREPPGKADRTYRLALTLLSNSPKAKQEKIAVDLLRAAALEEHAGAQLLLGVYHYKGVHVERDEKKGFAWVFQAAKNGEARAVYIMSLAMALGRGVQEERVAAFSLLQGLETTVNDDRVGRALDSLYPTLPPADLDKLKWK